MGQGAASCVRVDLGAHVGQDVVLHDVYREHLGEARGLQAVVAALSGVEMLLPCSRGAGASLQGCQLALGQDAVDLQHPQESLPVREPVV